MERVNCGASAGKARAKQEGESGFTAGFAIRADALRAIRGCSRARDRRWGTENAKRENRELWNPTLARQGWGTLMSLSGESGFTAGFAIRADALRAIRGCSHAGIGGGERKT